MSTTDEARLDWIGLDSRGKGARSQSCVHWARLEKNGPASFLDGGPLPIELPPLLGFQAKPRTANATPVCSVWLQHQTSTHLVSVKPVPPRQDSRAQPTFVPPSCSFAAVHTTHHGAAPIIAAVRLQHRALRRLRTGSQIRSSGHVPITRHSAREMHTELCRQGHIGRCDGDCQWKQGRWHACQHARECYLGRRWSAIQARAV